MPNPNPYITEEEYNSLIAVERKTQRYYYITDKRTPAYGKTIDAAALATLYNPELLRLMFQRGARLEEKTVKIKTAGLMGNKIPFSFFVASYGNQTAFEVALPHINIHRTINEHYATLLHIGAVMGKPYIVRELLKQGANPNVRTAPYFDTALQHTFQFDSFYRSEISSIIRSEADNQRSRDIILENVSLLVSGMDSATLLARNYQSEHFLSIALAQKLLRPLEPILQKVLELGVLPEFSKLLQEKDKYSVLLKQETLQEYEKMLAPYVQKHTLEQNLQRVDSSLKQHLVRAKNSTHKI